MKNISIKVLFISFFATTIVLSGAQTSVLPDKFTAGLKDGLVEVGSSLCTVVKSNPKVAVALLVAAVAVDLVCDGYNPILLAWKKIKSISDKKWLRRGIIGGLAAKALHSDKFIRVVTSHEAKSIGMILGIFSIYATVMKETLGRDTEITKTAYSRYPKELGNCVR